MGIDVARNRGETRRSKALAATVANLGVPCLGCTDCRGICTELLEALVLPDVILNDRHTWP